MVGKRGRQRHCCWKPDHIIFNTFNAAQLFSVNVSKFSPPANLLYQFFTDSKQEWIETLLSDEVVSGLADEDNRIPLIALATSPACTLGFAKVFSIDLNT